MIFEAGRGGAASQGSGVSVVIEVWLEQGVMLNDLFEIGSAAKGSWFPEMGEETTRFLM